MLPNVLKIDTGRDNLNLREDKIVQQYNVSDLFSKLSTDVGISNFHVKTRPANNILNIYYSSLNLPGFIDNFSINVAKNIYYFY